MKMTRKDPISGDKKEYQIIKQTNLFVWFFDGFEVKKEHKLHWVTE